MVVKSGYWVWSKGLIALFALISIDAHALTPDELRLVEKNCVLQSLRFAPSIPGAVVSKYRVAPFDRSRMASFLLGDHKDETSVNVVAIMYGVSNARLSMSPGESLDAYKERLKPLVEKGTSASLDVFVTLSSGSLQTTFRTVCGADNTGDVSSFMLGIVE